jgi:glutaredoxin 2
LSDFQSRFEQKIKDLDPYLKSLPTLTATIPDLTRDRVRLFLKRSSQLLAQVDKGRVRRPAFLTHPQGHLANAIIQNLDQIPSHASDANSFMQHILVPQVEWQRKLEFAVGLTAQEFENIKQKTVGELKDYLRETQELIESINSEKEEAATLLHDVTDRANAIRASIEEISVIVARGEKFRERLEKLDGDARRADSMERLVRSVTKKVSDAEEIADQIPSLHSSANELANNISLLHAQIRTERDEIVEIRKTAEKILGLASQAGLANSYIQERTSLSWKRWAYNAVFYVGIIVLAITASIYVLPVIENFAVRSGDISLGERALVLLIRSIVLAPIIWALMFTSSRIKMIEALEIDYAEKAAA